MGKSEGAGRKPRAHGFSPASDDVLRTLLASAPDAVACIDADGRIVFLNDRTCAFFGYEPAELIGQPVELLIPERQRDAHVAHRSTYLRKPHPRPMGAPGLSLVGRRKDGTIFPVDISLSSMETEGGLLAIAFIRDITDRVKAKEDAARREAEFRRRQALELNDAIVQGLAAGVYALESGELKSALQAISLTLGRVRRMMGELLTSSPAPGNVRPGDLVRAMPAVVGLERPAGPPPSPGDAAPGRAIRVLIADDTADIRLFLRFGLGQDAGFEVAGEASTGEEAIRLAETLQADVILLDLAMPVMDGLQAIPQIRVRAPNTKIVVLSGYGAREMEADAIRLGAHAFVEKGAAIHDLAALLRELHLGVSPPGGLTAPSGETTDAARIDAEALLTAYLHELRTPITVIQGVAETLRARIDALPSTVVLEFIDSVRRQIAQMGALVDAFADARRFEVEELNLIRESTDVGVLVEQTLADLAHVTKNHPLTGTFAKGIVAFVDPVRVRQVLTNLVSNAVKYSPRGRSIEVELRAVEDFVVLSVTDHGPGIPEDVRAKLFGKYAHFGEGSGVGLGLYISRAIARAHGGNLILAHSDAVRTTFVLALPISGRIRPAEKKQSASSS